MVVQQASGGDLKQWRLRRTCDKGKSHGKAVQRRDLNKIINKGINYYSDPQFNELLGRADSLILQLVVDALSATDTVTAQYQVSNDGAPIAALWANISNLAPAVTPSTASDVPKATLARNGTTDTMAAFGRVQVSCAAVNGIAVRVIACGRTDV